MRAHEDEKVMWLVCEPVGESKTTAEVKSRHRILGVAKKRAEGKQFVTRGRALPGAMVALFESGGWLVVVKAP